MIRLRKGREPAVLVKNSAKWTKEFCEFQGRLSEMPPAMRYRYRDSTIKAAVRQDSHDKCVYCESSISQVHPGEIDHIEPVSRRRDLVVAWDNLALVCSECNRAKGDYYEPTLPLLNPFVDDPASHLVFYGPLVLHRTGCSRGEATVKRLKLSRAALFERRKERIEALQTMLDRIHSMEPGPLRAAVEAALEDELAETTAYSATARAFVSQAQVAPTKSGPE
jgi:CRISPR/Cas system Type II protein with McrA/HNH and RuvC-like nuclease domain